jgi:hypothetical protein
MEDVVAESQLQWSLSSASALYGVGAGDPVTLLAVVTLFVGVAALASFVPAMRASRTSPSEVLRRD